MDETLLLFFSHFSAFGLSWALLRLLLPLSGLLESTPALVVTALLGGAAYIVPVMGHPAYDGRRVIIVVTESYINNLFNNICFYIANVGTYSQRNMIFKSFETQDT